MPTGASDDEMQAAAADIGFSETAFLLPQAGGGHRIRYFSPLAEVPFCGHATIATAVAYAERHGPGELALQTAAGLVGRHEPGHAGRTRGQPGQRAAAR